MRLKRAGVSRPSNCCGVTISIGPERRPGAGPRPVDWKQPQRTVMQNSSASAGRAIAVMLPRAQLISVLHDTQGAQQGRSETS